jgi:hypothetical protein
MLKIDIFDWTLVHIKGGKKKKGELRSMAPPLGSVSKKLKKTLKTGFH